MSNIKTKREKLQTILTTTRQALKELQTACDHSGELTYMYEGSSGNWDKSDDSYWINWNCKECGKQWVTEQALTEVQKYPNGMRIHKNR